MKKLIYQILICIFFVSEIDAQNYLSIPDSAAKWINYGYSFSPIGSNIGINYTFGSKYYTDGSDTLINGQNYFEVKESNYYVAALRNDIGKVYIVPKDSIIEYLLYDFTVQAGDTLHNIYTNHGVVQDLPVLEVTSDTIGGAMRRTIHFIGTDWIEGIGCDQGLFTEPYLNVSNFYFTLMCFSVGDSSYYPNESYTACDFSINLDLEPKYRQTEINIYPNPANDFLYVSNPHKKIKSIAVYNSIGEQIMSEKYFVSDIHKISIKEFSVGMYYVTICYDDFVVQKMFIKN